MLKVSTGGRAKKHIWPFLEIIKGIQMIFLSLGPDTTVFLQPT